MQIYTNEIIDNRVEYQKLLIPLPLTHLTQIFYSTPLSLTNLTQINKKWPENKALLLRTK